MRILISMPSLTGNVPIALVQALLSLKTKLDWEIRFGFTERVLVDRARNALAEKCLNEGFDYLFFLDDDQIPPLDVLIQMMELNKDVVVCPVADRNGEGTIALFDFQFSRIVQIKEPMVVGSGGMSCTLIRRAVLEKVAERFGKPFEFEKFNGAEISEDLNFCRRAKVVGFETWAIPMKVQHIGRRVTFTYDPEKNEVEAGII